jgi:NTE family protein
LEKGRRRSAWYDFFEGICMLQINLILSGGGARGIAHLGVVKALYEYKFQIHAISGVSSGAIAGAFIANGKSPEETLEISLEHAIFNIKRPPFSFGLFRKPNMRRVLEKFFPENSFERLTIPLFVSATNISTGNSEYFSSGELIMPLIASSALPVLFAPVEINENQYLDGGLLNNLPVEPFLDEEYTRIGVHVNPVGSSDHLSSSLKIIERSIVLAVYKNIRQSKLHCDLFIEPPELRKFSTFGFSKARELFKKGYEFAKIALDNFLETKAVPKDFISAA